MHEIRPPAFTGLIPAYFQLQSTNIIKQHSEESCTFILCRHHLLPPVLIFINVFVCAGAEGQETDRRGRERRGRCRQWQNCENSFLFPAQMLHSRCDYQWNCVTSWQDEDDAEQDNDVEEDEEDVGEDEEDGEGKCQLRGWPATSWSRWGTADWRLTSLLST